MCTTLMYDVYDCIESTEMVDVKLKVGDTECPLHVLPSTPHVKLKVRDTECPPQVCQLSRSSESTHFRSFVEM